MAIRFRLGSRGSPLALVQAHMTRDAIAAAHDWPVEAIEIDITFADPASTPRLARVLLYPRA